MSVCDDFIAFDQSDDWEQIINITFTATILGESSYIPIGEKDLGITLTEPYIVIVVQPSEAKNTWKYGGEVRQTWSFATNNQTTNQVSVAQSKPTQLFINKPQVIATPKNSVDGFGLRYSSPTWFKQVTVIAWKYIGEIQNFTKDTLLDISNAINTGTSGNFAEISDRIEDLLTSVVTISERLTTIENAIATNTLSQETIDVIAGRLELEVIEETSQINQRINSLSNNLAEVLGDKEDADVLYRDNLDEEL